MTEASLLLLDAIDGFQRVTLSSQQMAPALGWRTSNQNQSTFLASTSEQAPSLHSHFIPVSTRFHSSGPFGTLAPAHLPSFEHCSLRLFESTMLQASSKQAQCVPSSTRHQSIAPLDPQMPAQLPVLEHSRRPGAMHVVRECAVSTASVVISSASLVAYVLAWSTSRGLCSLSWALAKIAWRVRMSSAETAMRLSVGIACVWSMSVLSLDLVLQALRSTYNSAKDSRAKG